MSLLDSGRVLIGHGEFDRVAIDVVDRAPDDWLIAKVEVACGIWSGEFGSHFYRGELRRFGRDLDRLYQNLSGTATLKPMEPNLELAVSGDGKGHITIEGKATADFHTGTYLVFTLQIDQTEIPAIVKSLLAADP